MLLDYAYWITQSLLAVAMLCAVYRVFRGPSVLDRVISVDVLLIVVASMFLTDMVINDSQDYIVFVVGTAVIGFMGAVAIARFVAVRRPESWQTGSDPQADPGLGGAVMAHEPEAPSTSEETAVRRMLQDDGYAAPELQDAEEVADPPEGQRNTSWFQALARTRVAQQRNSGATDFDGETRDGSGEATEEERG